MTHAHQTNEATGRKERKGLVSGKLVLLWLAGLSVVLPLIALPLVMQIRAEMAIGKEPLNWSQRADWPSPPIKHTTLQQRQSDFEFGGSGGHWRNLSFMVNRPQQAAVHACAKLAALPEAAFKKPAVRAKLEKLARQQPSFFYPRYLLGTWHRLQGDATAAHRAYDRAFARAPAVIAMKFVDPDKQPQAELAVGGIEVACDRVIHGKLDQTLELRYPHLQTNQRGMVYLPIYNTVYRLPRQPHPPGYKVIGKLKGWFKFPGRIGMPDPFVVWPESGLARP